MGPEVDEILQVEEVETKKAALRKVELGNMVSRQKEDQGPRGTEGKGTGLFLPAPPVTSQAGQKLCHQSNGFPFSLWDGRSFF